MEWRIREVMAEMLGHISVEVGNEFTTYGGRWYTNDVIGENE